MWRVTKTIIVSPLQPMEQVKHKNKVDVFTSVHTGHDNNQREVLVTVKFDDFDFGTLPWVGLLREADEYDAFVSKKVVTGGNKHEFWYHISEEEWNTYKWHVIVADNKDIIKDIKLN